MGRKKKVNIEKTIRVKNIKGIEIYGAIYSFNTSAEFVEAWPGIKMWLEIDAKNKALEA